MLCPCARPSVIPSVAIEDSDHVGRDLLFSLVALPAPEVRRTSCRSGLQAQQWHSHSWLCAFSAEVEAPDLQFILSLEGSGERRVSSAADHAVSLGGGSFSSNVMQTPATGL